MGEKVSSRHWPVPVLVTFMAALSLVGSEQAPSPLVRATTVAALVTAFALTVWLRRRERRAYETRLADLAAARAVAEDRLALSRELHDLVSGGLGAITVHAAVAQRLHRDPEGLRQALAQIEQAGHEATADLRRMLAVLRGGDAGARRGAPLAPCGAAPAEDLALRVVREALVNTARHAGPSPVRVEAGTGPGRLSLRVSDAGPGPDWVPQPGSGYGLTSLREQAQALGGSLTAGPVGDGFTVVLELPARVEDVCGPAPGLRRPGAPARVEDAGGEDAGPVRGSRPGRERADAGGRAGAGAPRPGGEAGA